MKGMIIGLLGPDSTGAKLGRQAKAVQKALKKERYKVVVSYDGDFEPGSVDVVFAVGKHDTGVSTAVDFCKEYGINMLGVGEHMKDIEPEDSFIYIYANKLSVALMSLYRDVYEHNGILVSLTEYQQDGKLLPSDFVKDLAVAAQTRLVHEIKVKGYHGIAAVPWEYRNNIPKQYYDDFSIYIARFKRDGAIALDVVEIYGRKDAAAAAVKVAELLFNSHMIFMLDYGVYSLRQLVQAKML